MCREIVGLASRISEGFILHGMGNSPSSRPKVSWCRPPLGVIKINVDGAFSLNNDKHGIGFVARDSLGKFIMAASRTSWSESSADLVEAKAIFWVLSTARDFNWKHIEVESDCKLV